jgi:RAD50-interacting protein 1
MAFLHKALATAPFRRIWREALNSLQDLLWNEVLIRERFTTLGAAQFYHDLTAIWAVIDDYIAGGSSSALGMLKLREGAQLLNLPVVERDGPMSVSSAYNRVFADNAEAKKVIDELGFSTITYIEARLVLQRRVEASD